MTIPGASRCSSSADAACLLDFEASLRGRLAGSSSRRPWWSTLSPRLSGRLRVLQPLRSELDERLFRLQDAVHGRGRSRHGHAPRLLLQVRVRLHARLHENSVKLCSFVSSKQRASSTLTLSWTSVFATRTTGSSRFSGLLLQRGLVRPVGRASLRGRSAGSSSRRSRGKLSQDVEEALNSRFALKVG